MANHMTGTGSKQPWTQFADEVIEKFYPKHGAIGCQKLLPDRTPNAIRQRASAMGIGMRNIKVPPRAAPLYPREGEELACDLALRDFRECEPAANLTWIIGSAA